MLTKKEKELVVAVMRGDAEMVGEFLKKQFVSKRMSPDTVDAAGNPILCIAAFYGHIEVIKKLIAAHADVDKVNCCG